MEANVTAQNYRQCLHVALAAVLTESGYDRCDRMAMETLGEMAQGFLHEVGRSGRAFCELACRSEPLGADVVLALTEMGTLGTHGIKGLRDYALRTGRKSLGHPSVAAQPKQPSMLHTGDKRKEGRGGRSAVIPDYMAEFPDSHSYIRTPTHRQPEHDYETVREKAASQKRDVERALTRFIAKTCGKTHSLFKTGDTNLFPLISCDPAATRATSTSMAQATQLFHHSNPGAPQAMPYDALMDQLPPVPPYVSALLFRDQLFEEDEREYLPKKKAKAEEAHEEDLEEEEEEAAEEGKEEKEGGNDGDEEEAEAAAKEKKGKGKAKEEALAQPAPVNNPFLRVARTPRNAIVGATVPSRRTML